jgi:SM-20-related protein
MLLSSVFELAPRSDRERLQQAFARDRRVQIPDFLAPDSATEIARDLKQRQDWRRIVNSGSNVFEFDRATFGALTLEQRDALDNAVHRGARDGFQFRYEAIRVPDAAAERQASSDLLARFASWISAGPARELLCDVTGFDMIAFADAQATAYGPGDFLTAHDDDVEGKGRLAAYVLSLTPFWRIEWGGMLLFHGPDGNVDQGLPPRFNALNLFAVPQLHSVSAVTRAAPYRRYSITGWLRK